MTLFLTTAKSEGRNFLKQDDVLAACLVVTAKDSTVPTSNNATEHDPEPADSSYIIAIYFSSTFFNIIFSLLSDCPHDRLPRGNRFEFSLSIRSYTEAPCPPLNSVLEFHYLTTQGTLFNLQSYYLIALTLFFRIRISNIRTYIEYHKHASLLH